MAYKKYKRKQQQNVFISGITVSESLVGNVCEHTVHHRSMKGVNQTLKK